MNRRIPIIAASAALVVGGIVLILPSAVAAHANAVTCIDQATSTWRIVNDFGLSETFTTLEGPSGSVAAGNGSFTDVVYFGDTLTVHAEWSDGFTRTDVGNGDCTPGVIPTTTTTTEASTTSTTTTTLPASTSTSSTTVPATTTTGPSSTSTTSSEPSTTTTEPTTSSSVAPTSTTSEPGSSTTTTTTPPSSVPPAPSSTMPSTVSPTTSPPTTLTPSVPTSSTSWPCTSLPTTSTVNSPASITSLPPTASSPPCERCDAPPGTESDAGCILPPPMLPATGPGAVDPMLLIGLGLSLVIPGGALLRFVKARAR